MVIKQVIRSRTLIALIGGVLVCACSEKENAIETASADIDESVVMVQTSLESESRRQEGAALEYAAQPRKRGKLNDTGITWGGNYPKDINDDCSAKIDTDNLPDGESITGDILAQQDCASGRDMFAAKRDGATAFSYQKIDRNGKPLERGVSAWGCVLDEVSGLMWEVKHPVDGEYGNAGLHDGDDLFTWYSSVRVENGGAIGDWNSRFNQCAGFEEGKPMSFCNMEEFTRRVNEQGLCGYSDWRIPSRPELDSLVNFGRTMPAIDTEYFPNTKNEFYWSRSATAGFKESAWAVSFQFGYAAALQRTNSRPVRLVRAGAN